MGNPPEKPHPTHPIQHFTPFRLTTCAIASSALALGAFGTGGFHFNRSSIAELTADALRESTKLDAQSDFLEAFAHALNGPLDEFRDALSEAWNERVETTERDSRTLMRLPSRRLLPGVELVEEAFGIHAKSPPHMRPPLAGQTQLDQEGALV